MVSGAVWWLCRPILSPSLIDLNKKVEEHEEAGEIDSEWRTRKLRKLTDGEPGNWGK